MEEEVEGLFGLPGFLGFAAPGAGLIFGLPSASTPSGSLRPATATEIKDDGALLLLSCWLLGVGRASGFCLAVSSGSSRIAISSLMRLPESRPVSSSH